MTYSKDWNNGWKVKSRITLWSCCSWTLKWWFMLNCIEMAYAATLRRRVKNLPMITLFGTFPWYSSIIYTMLGSTIFRQKFQVVEQIETESNLDAKHSLRCHWQQPYLMRLISLSSQLCRENKLSSRGPKREDEHFKFALRHLGASTKHLPFQRRWSEAQQKATA